MMRKPVSQRKKEEDANMSNQPAVIIQVDEKRPFHFHVTYKGETFLADDIEAFALCRLLDVDRYRVMVPSVLPAEVWINPNTGEQVSGGIDQIRPFANC